MGHIKPVLLFFAVLTLLLSFEASAVAQQKPPKRKLIVGTKVVAPFAFKEKGRWKGISIDLWEEIAAKLGYEFEWKELESTNALLRMWPRETVMWESLRSR